MPPITPEIDTKFTEYSDEYGAIGMLYDPENDDAWIQTNTWTAVER